MPLNKKPKESKQDYISRCISTEVKSGKSQDQAIAICYSKWKQFDADEKYEKRIETASIKLKR